MVGGHFPHHIFRYFSLFIQLIQVHNIPFLHHLQEFHEDMCRTLRVIHRAVVIVQRNAHRLCHRIQLETVQARQKKTCHRHGIGNGKLPADSLKFTVPLDKTHIEACVVRHHDGPLTELHKLRQHRLDHRSVKHHTVVDMGQLFDPERDRRLRVDEGGKPVHDFSRLHTDGSDLDDLVHHRRETGGLNIKDHIGSIQILTVTVGHQILQIIHQIRFHSIDDLERRGDLFQFVLGDFRVLFLIFLPVGAVNVFHRMVCLRKRLDHAVVRDGNGGMSPLVGALYQLRCVGDAVHIAHLRMAVQLHTFLRAGIPAAFAEITALFDPEHGHDRQLPVKGIHRRASFQLHKSPRLHRRRKFRYFFVFQEDLDADGICEICDRKHKDRTLIPDLPFVHALDSSADHHIADLITDPGDLHAFLIEIPAIEDVRVGRAVTPAVVEFPPFGASGKSFSALSLEFSVRRLGRFVPGVFGTFSGFFRPVLRTFAGRSAVLFPAGGILPLSGEPLTDPGTRKDTADFFLDLPLGIFQRLALSLWSRQFRIYFQIQAAALTENLLQDPHQFLFSFPCHHGICQLQTHRIRLRKRNLRRIKDIEQKNAVAFQLRLNTGTVHLQQIFRRILGGKPEPFDDLHLHRHICEQLLFDQIFQLVNIPFVDPLGAQQINSQKVLFFIQRNPLHLHPLQQFRQSALHLYTGKYFPKSFVHISSSFTFPNVPVPPGAPAAILPPEPFSQFHLS